MRLNRENLDLVGADIVRPTYDRTATPSIVHLGVGAFHRAHQAVYNDDAMSQVPNSGRWMTTGISLNSPNARNQLAPQDNLFAVRILDSETDSLRIIGSLGRTLFAGDQADAAMAVLCAETTRIITMTITEKGYYRQPSGGALDAGATDVRHDLAHPATPRTAIGWIASALAARRTAGRPGLTIVSCDNLPNNGDAVRRVLLDFCERRDPELRRWVEANVTFPSTMVDRIVPAPTDETRAALSARLGVRDQAGVVTEPFSQWVIEDDFCRGRPAWERAGAFMTAEIALFETMKLRLLNGAHSALAYLGHLAGHRFVSDCVTDPVMRGYIRTMMRDEIMPTVACPAGFSLAGYIDQLMQRFANPQLRHRCLQIAMDGSQKLPQRQLNTIRDRLARRQSFDRLAVAVAAWMIFVTGRDLDSRQHQVDDPLARLLARRTAGLDRDPQALVTSLLTLPQIFGDLSTSAGFRGLLTRQVTSLYQSGVDATLASVGRSL